MRCARRRAGIRSCSTRPPIASPATWAAITSPGVSWLGTPSRRGVPFTEKRVQTAADVRAFNKLQPGTSQFPLLTVGTDRMVGFEAGMWNRMLDAAAYPRSSMLPPNYLARTLEPMSPPEDKPKASAEESRPNSAQADADVGGLLTPAQQERFENPIRF